MSEKESNKEIETFETPASETSNQIETVEKSSTEATETEGNTGKEILKTIPKNTTPVEEKKVRIKDDEKSENKEELSIIDYSKLSELELISELKAVLDSKPVNEIKEVVEIIKNEFNSKFQDELEKNKESFLAKGGNIIDFYFTTPEKKEFDTSYYYYKDKRSNYYKNLQKDQKANLIKREEIIEELKSLFNAKENTSTIYKRFRDIQERWFDAGSIPRDKYNTVWNNYHHHVENFYDILHLDREFRDRNFKQNLEHKLRLIGRAEELTKEENNNKAFRELQMLHKMWKEEIGPVAKEFSDDIWDKFSAATKIIHDKRNQHLEQLEVEAEKNVDFKIEIINNINSLNRHCEK